MNKNQKIISSIAKMAILLALLIVSSYITIPVGVLKFTLQLLVVLLIGFYSNLLESIIVIVSYIFLGLVGVPVFANFSGGIQYISNPTFGFVYGFFFGVLVMQLFKFLFKKCIKFKFLRYLIISLICLMIVYFVGFIHGYFTFNYYLGKNYSVANLLMLFIVPYIPFDLIKIGVAILSKFAVDKVYKYDLSKI